MHILGERGGGYHFIWVETIDNLMTDTAFKSLFQCL